ncbi:MAG: leucine-rich repeat domain-containing protein [Chitinophagales bacterium]
MTKSKINYSDLLQKKKAKVKKYSKADLFAATSIVYKDHWNYQQIRRVAISYLKYFHSKGTIEDFPIEESSEIVFVGQTKHLKFREVRERLLPLGVGCKVFVKKTTTHVVLGGGAKKGKGFLEHDVTIISPKELNIALERLEQPYLLEKTEDSSDNVQNLANLLLSNQDENIALALEIFKGGGFPKELLHELLIAYKMTHTTKIRERARALLYLHISDSSKHALKRLHNLSKGISERSLAKGIYRMTNDAPEFDGVKIAQLMYEKHHKGLTYLLEYLPHQEKMDWLKKRIQNDELNLSKSSVYKLPKEIGQLKSVKSVNVSNCSFSSVPQVLSKLPKLEKIDLSNNRIYNLPVHFSKMNNLKCLNISNNGFRDVPPILLKMPQLEELHINFRAWIWQRSTTIHEGIEELKQALPNCKIVTNK